MNMILRNEEEIIQGWNREQIKTPVVSIRCLAYNHEQYIAQCLDGFLMQVTTFPFQIVVHDDASTDKTASIIKSYEEKYPHIIIALYEEENLYSKHDGSLGKRIDSFCQGKYIAFCEGDDFWTDENKLQIQFDSLESNPDCSLSTCLVQECDVDGTPLNKTVPCKDYGLTSFNGIITQRDFARMYWENDGLYPFQTSSYFIRREALFKPIPELGQYLKYSRGVLLRAIYLGNIFYHNKAMSSWRRNVPGSWVDRHKRNENNMVIETLTIKFFMDIHFDKCTEGLHRDIIFPAAIRRVLAIADNVLSITDEVIPGNNIVDLFNSYVHLIGNEEFKRHTKLFMKREPINYRLKLRLFLFSPKFYIIIERMVLRSKKIKP